MTKLHMVGALNQALEQEMARDKSVMCLGEDVGVDGGVFRVTDGLITKFGKDRVVDTPLAEAGIIGVSIGLALNGMKPVAEIQFVGFSYQAFHHVKQHMSCFRQRSDGTRGIPMVLRSPCGGGIRALEHHSDSPEALFVHCQGIKVVCPSNPYDAKGLLISSIRDPDPVIFLEPEKLYRSFKDEVPDDIYTVPLGDAKIVKEGKDVTVISWGAMVHVAKDAADLLQKDGIDAEVIDLRTIWPMDVPKLLQSARKTGRVVIVHEAPRTAGMGAEIATRIQEEAMFSLNGPILRVCGFDMSYPMFAWEEYYLPNVKRVIKAVKQSMSY